MIKLGRKMIIVFLALLAFIACYPVLFLAVGSLMEKQEVREALGGILSGGSEFVSWRFVPLYPTLASWVELMLDSPQFFVMFWNSVRLTAGVLLGQLVIAVPAAWGFARYDFPLKRILFMVYVILMMMPFQVTMLSGYLVLSGLRLLDTYGSIWLPGIFSTFPVFIMYRFFRGIPGAVIEAAKLDGAGDLQIFFYLGLPLGSGGIVSAMVLGFLEYWNLIEQPLAYLKDPSLWPLSLYLPNIGLEEAGLAFCASVTVLIPALFAFFAGQDYLEQGIVAAAVKE